MAYKYLGTGTLKVPLNVQTPSPLDNRTVVNSIKDLEALTDTDYVYQGMMIVVVETNEIYILADLTKLGTKEAWVKVGSNFVDGWGLELKFTNIHNFILMSTTTSTIVSTLITLKDVDVTDTVLSRATTICWTRDTGNIPSDNAWTPTYCDLQGNIIENAYGVDRKNLLLRNTSEVKDFGLHWGDSQRCSFYLTIEGDFGIINGTVIV